MSYDIRAYVYDFITAKLSDDAILRIGRLLLVAPDKHKIPVTITLNFMVNADGDVTLEAKMKTSWDEVPWDTPLNLSGGQLSLFNRPMPAPKMTPVETVSPPQLNDPVEKMIPEAELAEPTLTMGMPDAPAEPAEPSTREVLEPVEQRLSAIQQKNADLLARVDKGELRLDPAAEKALREMAEKG